MTDLDATLSERIGELVRGVPGVETLYPSRSVIATVTDAAIGTVRREHERRPPVSVVETGDGITVSAVIGIRADVPATVLCHRVYDAVAAHLTANALPIAAIEVRVGSIG